MTGRRPRRKCTACGGWLASDNRTDQCSPCRAANRTGDGPPTLPDNFWDLPELRKALETKHFSTVLQAYVDHCGRRVTQAELGEWLGLSQVHVGRILRGVRPADNIMKLARWARTLGIPSRCLWFSAPTEIIDVDEPVLGTATLTDLANSEGDHVRRRQFLKTAGVGLGSVGTSLLADRADRWTWDAGSSDSYEVAQVRTMIQGFRQLDNRFGGGHSKADMYAYMKMFVEPKLNRASGPSKSELFLAAAELHQLAGWMAYDTGQAAEGRKYMRQALRLSQEAGSEALSAEMLAGMSHHAAFHGAPEAGAAVDLALAAGQSAKRSGQPLLVAESAVMEAHGLALQGDKRGCLYALHSAEQAFNEHRDAAPSWLAYFDTAYLAAKFAHSFRDLGQPREAEIFARRSLEMNDGYQRGKLFNTALLASILADQKRVEEACQSASLALKMMSSVRSVRCAAYLSDVARRLAPFKATSDVQALYNRMIENGIRVPVV